MVEVLFLDTFESNNPSHLLAISTEYRFEKESGRSQSFFSNQTVYDSTVLVQQSASGAETGYFGHVAVTPHGALGFSPEAVLTGDIDGMSLREFLAHEIVGHIGSIWTDMLVGDDIIRGAGFTELHGYDGDDVLIAGLSFTRGSYGYLSGDNGNDVLFTGSAGRLSGGDGADLFFVDRLEDIGKLVTDFQHNSDQIAFSEDVFHELGHQVKRNEIHFGRAAADQNDHIIVDRNRHTLAFDIFYDRDGNGPSEQSLIASIDSDHKVSVRDFAVARASDFIPDGFGAPPGGSAPHFVPIDYPWTAVGALAHDFHPLAQFA